MPDLYDEESGAEKPEEIARQVSAADQQAADSAQAAIAMMQTPGFQIFETFLLDTLNQATRALVDEKEWREMVRRQEQVKAYSDVLGWFTQQTQILEQLRQQSAASANQASLAGDNQE